MSFDLSLASVCDHRVYRERCILDGDRKSLRVSKPVASVGTLSVWASDSQVPKSDYSVVYDTGSATGETRADAVWVVTDPNIATGQVLSVDTASNTVHMVDGTRVLLNSATRIYTVRGGSFGALAAQQYVRVVGSPVPRTVYILSSQVGATGQVASVNAASSSFTLYSGAEYLVGTSTTVALMAATTVAGLAPGQYLAVFGKTSIVQPAAQNPYRMVRFRYRWKGDDYFEVTYNTLKGYCPKCVGLGALDDLSWDVRGQLARETNEKLLLQNLEKFVVTALGSNPFHTFIGTGLKGLIGHRVSDPDYLSTQITQEVYTTLAKLKDMQQQYVRAGREMTPGEQLQSILKVNVVRDSNDPTIYMVEVSVTSMAGQTVNYTQYLKTASRA